MKPSEALRIAAHWAKSGGGDGNIRRLKKAAAIIEKDIAPRLELLEELEQEVTGMLSARKVELSAVQEAHILAYDRLSIYRKAFDDE